MVVEYRNEPYLDFSLEENKKAMQQAIAEVEAQCGQEYPLIIGGEKIFTEDKIVSINPGKNDEVIGSTAKADVALAEKAMEKAQDAFKSWKKVPPAVRAGYLFKAGAIMKRRKLELSAWMVKESGKNWLEAIADTAEAIDFIEFYAREMIRLAQGQEVIPVEGHDNEVIYIPIGVGVVIPPWNFPLAILTGLTVGPVVAGNTVVVKPASNTPVIAVKLMEILEEAGLPAGVVNFLPGSGGAIGDYLVKHPQTRFINFTGSKEVGLRINKLAAEMQPGQIWLKRVAAEMGGKDAIIVNSDADLAAAADGIVKSAFGFQGQKCSACSRAIIVADVYDQIIEKVAALSKEIKVGPVENGDNFMGAVIDKTAFQKTLDYIEIGKQEGRLLAGGAAGPEGGYYIQPTVFADVDPQARIAQEEIFAPVLAIIKAQDFDEAIQIANDTEYGLTGGVFAKSRECLEKARADFHVGNLYFNRKCTGALVGAEPFGGFNMSGTCAKAGGKDYLLLFLQQKTISEKL
ncbi:MAG: L-glutamate gamma-semialdehyde dehydrogenase [Peptococcaceae bacterium]